MEGEEHWPVIGPSEVSVQSNHLASLGHPIVGDERYGARPIPHKRPALHAHRLSLRHPAKGDQLTFEAPLPADMLRTLGALRRWRSRTTP